MVVYIRLAWDCSHLWLCETGSDPSTCFDSWTAWQTSSHNGHERRNVPPTVLFSINRVLCYCTLKRYVFR